MNPQQDVVLPSLNYMTTLRMSRGMSLRKRDKSVGNPNIECDKEDKMSKKKVLKNLFLMVH